MGTAAKATSFPWLWCEWIAVRIHTWRFIGIHAAPCVAHGVIRHAVIVDRSTTIKRPRCLGTDGTTAARNGRTKPSRQHCNRNAGGVRHACVGCYRGLHLEDILHTNLKEREDYNGRMFVHQA